MVLTTLLTDIGIYLVVGAVAGTLAGLLGIGGGIIVVPSLIFVFHLQGYADPSFIMHMAAGTSLAVMVITSLSSAKSHAKRGSLNKPLMYRIMPGIAVGVMIGAVLAHFIHSGALRYVFALFLVGIAIRVGYKMLGRSGKKGRALPSGPMLNCHVACMGIVSGMLGIGLGTMAVPYLSRYRFDMAKIAGTSSAGSALVGLVGAITYIFLGSDVVAAMPFSTGYVYWPAFAGIAVATLFFAPVGTKLSHVLSEKQSKSVFLVLLLLLALHMIGVI